MPVPHPVQRLISQIDCFGYGPASRGVQTESRRTSARRLLTRHVSGPWRCLVRHTVPYLAGLIDYPH